MFYFEGIIDNNGKNFYLEKVYCNMRVINEGVNDLLIYQGTNLIARIKSGENLTFRNFKAENLTLKTQIGITTIRFWLW